MALSTGFATAQRIHGKCSKSLGGTRAPKLQPREPWFGYELGYWSDEEREEAELALAGKHYEVGERAEKNRKKL